MNDKKKKGKVFSRVKIKQIREDRKRGKGLSLTESEGKKTEGAILYQALFRRHVEEGGEGKEGLQHRDLAKKKNGFANRSGRIVEQGGKRADLLAKRGKELTRIRSMNPVGEGGKEKPVLSRRPRKIAPFGRKGDLCQYRENGVFGIY